MKLLLCPCENGSEMTGHILPNFKHRLPYVIDTLSRELGPQVRKPVVLTVSGILLRELFLGIPATGPE